MAEHKEFTYAHIHKARFDSGLAAALPGAAEGVGDAYYATDTNVLYVGLSDLTWVILSGGGGGGLAYEGTRAYISSDVLLPGDDSSTYLNWNGVVWEQGGDFGSFPGSGFNQPHTGFWEFGLNLILENTAPARWHLETWYDGGDTNLTMRDFTTDGAGGDTFLSLTDQFLALKDTGAGGYFYVYLYQNGGVDLNVRAFSSLTLKRIGDSP